MTAVPGRPEDDAEDIGDDTVDPVDPVDALLVRCLRQPEQQRAATLEQLCAREPQRAAQLRRRYAFLCESGLLEIAAGNAPFPERIGGFRLRRRLGEGGMGVVYLADQESLGRQVALKLIRRELLHSPRARERFRREALAASRLAHPGICPVYEVGEADGLPFLVMRHVPGRSLAEHLQELRRQGQKPDFRTIVARIEKVARALHAAHQAGLVHRDVKPGNIQLGDDGEPVLLDFGLSLLLEGEQPAMTATGDVLGTPAYLAPEQIDGRGRVSPTTDVYALGVVLYECLTLHAPFAAATRESLYRRILQGQPERANRRNRAVPADLQVVLEVAMDRDPARRYASAGAFADDLAHVLRAEPIAARRIPPWLRARRWCQRNPFAATALATLAAGLVATGLLLGEVHRSARELAAQNEARTFWDLKDRDPKQAVRAAIAAQDLAGPEAEAALRAALTLAWPEDGFLPQEMFVLGCGVDRQGQRAVWIDMNGGGWLWRIGSGKAGVHPFRVQSTWSPQVQFAPDGQRFAVAGNDHDERDPQQSPSVTLFDRDGKQLRKLGPHPGGVIAVAWHPTRPLLAVGCRNPMGRRTMHDAIVLWDVERFERVREIPQATWPWNVTFDADGRLLIATGARHLEWVHAFEDVARFPVEVRSVEGERLGFHELHEKPVFRMATQDGWLVTGGHDGRAVLWHYDADATPVELLGHGGAVCGVAFATDGAIVTACQDRSLRRFDRRGHLLFSFRIEGDGDNVLVVPGSGEIIVPCIDGVTRVFSPSGTLLHRFHSRRYDYPGEGVALLPGRRVLVGNGGLGLVGVWSLDAAHRQRVEGADRVLPDATHTALAVTLREPREIQIRRAEREPMRLPLSAPVGGLAFSPHSRWAAAGTVDGRIVVADLANNRWSQMSQQSGVAHLRFSADSRTFSTVGPHQEVNVYRCDPSNTWHHDGMFVSAQHAANVAYSVPLQIAGGELHLLMRTRGCGIWKWEKANTTRTPLQWLVDRKGIVARAADASEDGRRLALACSDRIVRLFTWNGTRAEPCAVELVHERPLEWCRFDRSGARIVTIDSDRFAWVWQWDGKLLACIRSPDNRTFRSAWFTENGREVVTVDEEQLVERWPIELAGASELLARRWRLQEDAPR